jgi:hypothetical protein
MPEFRRPYHRAVADLLAGFDGDFLRRAECYFGGGTQIALALGEFRESRDIDFLCSSPKGYRLLRETVNERSLGALLKKPLRLAREVRADRYGIRTFLHTGADPVKCEIVFEGRIGLSGRADRMLGVPVLDLPCIVAEKFLANADRGLDSSAKSRDLVDLAFLAAAHGSSALEAGYRMAQAAYGKAVERQLARALGKFAQRNHSQEVLQALGIEDRETLRKGLRSLRAFAPRLTRRSK